MTEREQKTTGPAEAELRWTGYLPRAAEGFAREWRGAVPEDFRDQARMSVREALRAVRSLLDRGIECLEKKQASAARKVPVL